MMRGRTICLWLLLLAVWPGAARAQQFSFGFATGGLHHGHHHHGHHHCGGGWYGFEIYQPRYVYPPPVVYAPPPVTYVYPAPAVQVVQPALTQVQPRSAEPSSLASSQSSTNSAMRLNALPVQSRSNVVLRNPAANAGAVAFRVQDQVDAELGAGTTRTWSDRASLIVEFDRGGEFGATRKILRPGAYDFVVTEEGWDLVATVSPATSSRAASLQKNALPARR
jgi:hypothetical protein